MFTSRAGGVSAAPFDTLNMSGSVGDQASAVATNRRRVAQACGLRPEQLSWMHQVHGAAVSYAPAGELPEADAMFTDTPARGLVVLVADCAPVLLADPQARIVGAAHAGREGMAAGVVAELHAVIGPHICGACYEVPAELQARVASQVPESACITRAGTTGIDIGAGIEAQLARAGVRTVAADPRCTAETPELYSYRRDGRTGRSAGLVWLTP